jgi:nucleotide-binding universal stress UspA family protein
MGIFGRIIAATDFSPASEPAVAQAVRLARAEDAELTLVHVYEPPGAASFGSYVASPGLYDEIEQALRSGAEKSLAPLVEAARKQGVRVTSRVLRGIPHSGITGAAVENHADLIVIGTHGRSGFFRFFLGSVAQKVIAAAPCPVMTVLPEPEEQKSGAAKGRAPRRKSAGRG